MAAGRLRAALGRPYALAGISLHVGASIGIAVFPDHAQDANTLLRHADVAMYEAKRGRTGHGVYASEATTTAATASSSPARCAMPWPTTS